MKINYEGTLMEPDTLPGFKGTLPKKPAPVPAQPRLFARLAVISLYLLAIATGIGGVLAGIIPLVTYAIARLKNPGFGYYTNLPLISTAENTLIFSLMLLIFVHVSHVLGAGLRRDTRKQNAPAESRPPANLVSWPAEMPRQRGEETPDEKLARLLK